jgi:regulator of sirC expression with transglutaminase-like and TPR domain
VAESSTTIRRMFTALMKRKEDRIDLGLAALLIAKEEYPRLAIEDYVERLDQLAAEFQVEVDVDADGHATCEALGRFLGDQHGFAGDPENYYDPRNSYLNDVMDRRAGIPISLSVLYIEVARRAGLKLLPVSFPGHFLIKHASERGDIYLDPYHSGRLMDVEDCRQLFANSYGSSKPFTESMLGAATKRQVITRMLQNLKGIYGRSEETEKALRVVELLTAVTPWDLDEVRDRGILRYRLGETEKALEDLRTYAEHAPPGPEVDSIREALRRLTQP